MARVATKYRGDAEVPVMNLPIIKLVIQQKFRTFRRWLAFKIYPEGIWNKDMSLEIDRLIQIIEDLGGKP
jgi:hypothetical protein